MQVLVQCFLHFLTLYHDVFRPPSAKCAYPKLWSESLVLITHMYVCFRMELTPAPRSVPRSTYRHKVPADTRVSLKCRDSAAGSGCATVQVSCWYTVGGRRCQSLGTVVGVICCYSEGTVAAAVRGQWLLHWGHWLLQCGDISWYSLETVAATEQAQWLLQ